MKRAVQFILLRRLQYCDGLSFLVFTAGLVFCLLSCIFHIVIVVRGLCRAEEESPFPPSSIFASTPCSVETSFFAAESSLFFNQKLSRLILLLLCNANYAQEQSIVPLRYSLAMQFKLQAASLAFNKLFKEYPARTPHKITGEVPK